MDIRRRLHISNIVMILVPTAIALAVGTACIAIIWALVTGGAPFGSDALEEYLGMADLSGNAEHQLKLIAMLATVVLLVAIVAAVVLTDRFMTRFVLRHVTGPLDRLSAGVQQIRNGNLEYRIAYEGKDEFAPVCAAFDEMAQRLAESVQRDRRNEESRRELITGMSHDLRSPLTSIRGYAEGLRDGVAADDASRARYVGVILEKTSDIERKVSQLLEMTRLGTGGCRIDSKPLDLDEYVRGFFKREGTELSEQGMEVSLRLEPATVLADSAELDRIMGNLLDNSLKYRKGDTVNVDIAITDNDSYATLAVSDDGNGVPDEDLARIFDPLYRGDAARSNSCEGSGLGLSIVAASISQMGGSVSAARSDAGGLSIHMQIPHAGKGEEASA